MRQFTQKTGWLAVVVLMYQRKTATEKTYKNARFLLLLFNKIQIGKKFFKKFIKKIDIF